MATAAILRTTDFWSFNKQFFGGASKKIKFDEKSLSKRRNLGVFAVASANAGTGGAGRFYINVTGFTFPLGPFLNRQTRRTEMQFSAYSVGTFNDFEIKHRSQHISSFDHNRAQRRYLCNGIKSEIPSTTMNQDADVFLLNAVRMSFLERVALAWKILFPTNADKRNSNAKIAKQRLKMILFADRCAVSDEAKQKIVSNIIKALSDFVEIEPQDKVELSVSTDVDLGTMYSVTVPVRRVKPGHQLSDEEYTGITGIEFKDKGETSGCVDVKFDFYVPSEKKRQIP